MKKGDKVAFVTKEGIKTSKIRALFRPKPLDEIRSPRDRFLSVDSVVAAAGVKVAAPGIEEAIPGSPLMVYSGEEVLEELKKEVEEVEFESDAIGVVVKADTLGTLEALVNMLKSRNIPIRKAEIGNVTKKDVIEAYTVRTEDRYRGVILAFNVSVDKNAEDEAKEKGVPIIRDNVIYRLIEAYEKYIEEEREREKRELLEKLVPPVKIQILKGYVFRRSDPAIVGVKVLAGVLRPKIPLMREDGKEVGTVRSIQTEGKTLEKAEKGMEVAVAIDGPMVGRHIFEDDVLYSKMPYEHIKVFLQKRHLVPDDYIEVLKEIMDILKKQGSKS